jgi:hypothetical protein
MADLLFKHKDMSIWLVEPERPVGVYDAQGVRCVMHLRDYLDKEVLKLLPTAPLCATVYARESPEVLLAKLLVEFRERCPALESLSLDDKISVELLPTDNLHHAIKALLAHRFGTVCEYRGAGRAVQFEMPDFFNHLQVVQYMREAIRHTQ